MFNFLDKWDSNSVKVKHLILFLLSYMVIHFIFFTFFYLGFNGAYSKVYNILGHIGIRFALLKYVPYHSWSPFLASFMHPLFALGVLLVCIPFIGKVSSVKWVNVEQYKWVRLLTFIAALLLAWELSTTDYNYYLNSPQYLDRILLIVLALLILRNPLFIVPFLILSLCYRSQFNYPIGGFPLMDKRVLFDLLIVLYTYILLNRYVKQFRVNYFFMVLCLIGSDYFIPGIGKVFISPHGYEWLAKNSMVNFFVNMHKYGWLNSASPHTLNLMLGFMHKFGLLFKLLTFFIEVSGLMLLKSRKGAGWFLLGFTCMHLGIFIFSGVFFWKWITIDLTLWFILFRLGTFNVDAIFNKANFRLSLVVILFSPLWFSPFTFDWFDTKASQFFTYQVVDDKGNVLNLERNSFNPYNQFFQYESFLYLVNDNTLDIRPFGNTNKFKEAREINNVSADPLPILLEFLGKNRYDSVKATAYRNFITIYFANRNKRVGASFIPSIFAAPYHLYNSSIAPVYSGNEKVTRFRAILNESYLAGTILSFNDYSIAYKQEVAMDIPIP